jgi:plasmid stabilization system protein ParE
VAAKRYVLTARAARDLAEAKTWSLARWGKQLTDQYFMDLHAGAQYIAEHHSSLRSRDELAAGTALLLYPVREHYLVYEPIDPRCVVIVAVIRQGRDVPAILRKWGLQIRRELDDIRSRIEAGTINSPSRAAKKRHIPRPRTNRKNDKAK